MNEYKKALAVIRREATFIIEKTFEIEEDPNLTHLPYNELEELIEEIATGSRTVIDWLINLSEVECD